MKRIYFLFHLIFFTNIECKPLLTASNKLNYLKALTNTNLDKTFGTSGLVITDFAKEIRASGRDMSIATALQSDQKLIAGGFTTAINNFLSFALTRYTQSGKLDDTFGNKGTVVSDLGELLGTGKNTLYSIIQSLEINPSDEKIIAGGAVSNPINALFNFALVKYNTNGTVDTTFGNNGVVLTDVGALNSMPNTSSQITSIIIQPDGKILAGGFAGNNGTLSIARYNSNGTLDTTFGNNGIVVSDIPTSLTMNIVFQTDGKIIGGGTVNNEFTLIRYNNDGSIDTTYGNNGIASANFGSNFQTFITSIGLTSDNKVVAGGTSLDTIDQFYFTLAKFNSDGSLDTTFGDSGKINKNLKNQQIFINKIAIQNDNKIITGGSIVAPPDPALSGAPFVLVRLNSNGTIDNTFGNNGVVITNFSRTFFEGLQVSTSIDIIFDITLANNGSIYPSGSTTFNDPNNDFAIAKYNQNGQLDKNYGTIFLGKKKGLIFTDFKKVLGIKAGSENAINGIGLQSNGKIITAGYSDVLDPNYDFIVARYDLDGTQDINYQFRIVDFSHFARISRIFYGTYDIANSLIIQRDDKAIIGGLSNVLGNLSFALARLNSDGSLDNFFGQQGLMVTNFGQIQNKNLSSDIINSLALQFKNKIIAAGSSSPNVQDLVSYFALARYNTNGSLNNSFGVLNKGIVLTNFGKNLNNIESFDEILSIAIQEDNKIVAAGFSTAQNPLGDFALARYNSDGTLDKTFGNKGLIITKFSTTKITQNQINKILIQADGKILAGGISSVSIPNFDPNNPRFNFALARYNIDGTLDKTFGNQGLVITEISEGGNNSKSNDLLFSLVINKENNIIAGGTSNAQDPNFDFTLVTYNNDGSVNKSVGNNGIIFTNFSTVLKNKTVFNSTDVIKTMTIQKNQKILAAGNTNLQNPNYNFAIARYNIKPKSICIDTNNQFILELRKKFKF